MSAPPYTTHGRTRALAMEDAIKYLVTQYTPQTQRAVTHSVINKLFQAIVVVFKYTKQNQCIRITSYNFFNISQQKQETAIIKSDLGNPNSNTILGYSEK